MEYLYLVFGIFIIVLVVTDIIITTLAPHGGGKITSIATKYSWKIFLYLGNNYGSTKVLNNSGMILISIVLVLWIGLLWLGYTLVFSFHESSIIHSETKEPASFIDKIYYVGYTLSTLGYGDFAGSNILWRVLSAFISFTGLILITIAITYLVPINTAEIYKRRLSIYIASLGSNPQDILIKGWDGSSFKRLNSHFNQLANMVLQNAQNNLAYPILHYFHTSKKQEAYTINITALDEALTILIYYIPQENRLEEQEIYPLRRAITAYLNTLAIAQIKSSKQSPEMPDIEKLEKNNIPIIVENEKLKESYQQLQERRKLLKALLKNDGWDWEDMQGPKFDSEFVI